MTKQVKHLETNKMCDLANVIAQLGHPYAPAINEIIVQGLKVSTVLKNGLSCSLQFTNKDDLNLFVEAARKNQKVNNLFVASQTRADIDLSDINPNAFKIRRSASYHGLKW